MKTLAVDIGGTFIKFGLVDEQHRVSGQCKVPTKVCADKKAFFDYLCGSMPPLTGVDRIGVCAPGLIDRAGNVKSYAAPSLDGMFGSNIPAEVTARTGLPCAASTTARLPGCAS